MNFKNLFLLLALVCLSTPNFAQKKPALAAKIEQLAEKVIQNIHTEEVFIKTGRSTIDTEDYKQVKKIVMSNGFPTISMVGKENSHKFWVMVQLCDFDIQFQMAVLKQMSRSVRKGDVIKEDYAMLTDRTRMNKEVPQLYGTQYVIDDDGELMLYRIYDHNNVNDRRKTLNLSKLDDSTKKVKEQRLLTKKGIDSKSVDESMRDN